MEKTPFKLQASYQPAGDQPQAIEKLVEGLNEGLAHQTLLGVTGSGKSVGYSDTLMIAEVAKGGDVRTRLVKAGPFIDSLLESHGLAQSDQHTETERYTCADRAFLTPAYDPLHGKTAWYPVAALLRHRAPERMFRLVTKCGRTVEATGDHNFWVLRDGALTLIKTEDAKPTDFMPVPDVVTSLSRQRLESIDIVSYLADTGLSVYAEDAVLEYVTAAGNSTFVSAMRACAIEQPCRLPARLPLTDNVLALFGYYVAEGSVGSSALTLLLKRLCGSTASQKRLPEFWPQLSDDQLGVLLSAYFDGDGTVGDGGEASATTASPDLASDLAYALKRFGIHARLRTAWKRATNSNHAGGMYHHVVVSGRSDLELFERFVGFSHPEKRERLNRFMIGRPDTNVDVVPIRADDLNSLRTGQGLSMERLAALAGCSRPMLSLIESGKRQPSRALLTRILDALAIYSRTRPITEFSWWIQWRELKALCAARWTRVARIESIEYPHPYVYDLSVPGPETFLSGSGGIFVHNTYSIANVIQRVQRPTMVLAHNKTLAAQLYGEFREFFPNNAVEYFVSYYDYYQPEAYVPSSDTYIEKDSSVNEHIEQMRLSATKALLERSDAIIVATVSSIYGLGDPQSYLSMILHLSRGDRIDQRQLLRRLAEMQYTRNELDLTQGTYRVRGDVIDIFPAESEREAAVRVELFDGHHRLDQRCSIRSPARFRGKCRDLRSIPAPTM